MSFSPFRYFNVTDKNIGPTRFGIATLVIVCFILITGFANVILLILLAYFAVSFILKSFRTNLLGD